MTSEPALQQIGLPKLRGTLWQQLRTAGASYGNHRRSFMSTESTWTARRQIDRLQARAIDLTQCVARLAFRVSSKAAGFRNITIALFGVSPFCLRYR